MKLQQAIDRATKGRDAARRESIKGILDRRRHNLQRQIESWGITDAIINDTEGIGLTLVASGIELRPWFGRYDDLEDFQVHGTCPTCGEAVWSERLYSAADLVAIGEMVKHFRPESSHKCSAVTTARPSLKYVIFTAEHSRDLNELVNNWITTNSITWDDIMSVSQSSAGYSIDGSVGTFVSVWYQGSD